MRSTLNLVPLAEMQLKDPITLKEKSEGLADHVAPVGGNEFRVGRKFLLSFAVDPERAREELTLGLGLDPRLHLNSWHV